MSKKQILLRAVVLGFVLTVLLQAAGFAAQCGSLESGVLRLHILANSDSEADQAVKLAVRDALLEAAPEWYGGADSFEEALAAVCTHLEGIEEVADRVLASSGVSYFSKAEVCDAYFPTRYYEGGALPAGKYRTLRVELGEAEGKNWWCVLFPSLCLPAAGMPEASALPKGTENVVTQPERYELRFRFAELLTELREFLEGA